MQKKVVFHYRNRNRFQRVIDSFLLKLKIKLYYIEIVLESKTVLYFAYYGPFTKLTLSHVYNSIPSPLMKYTFKIHKKVIIGYKEMEAVREQISSEL